MSQVVAYKVASNMIWPPHARYIVAFPSSRELEQEPPRLMCFICALYYLAF